MVARVDAQLRPGEARCPGVSWSDLLEEDSRTVPGILRDDDYSYLGSAPFAAGRYTDPEFFKAELRKMWPRVWQWAAREEDLPEPGDTVVYDNAGRTYLVTRQPDGSVRFTGDANTSYKFWGDHVNLAFTPCVVMSPHLDPKAHDQQWIVDEFVEYSGRSADNYDTGDAAPPQEEGGFNVKVPAGVTARRALGESMRQGYTKAFGHDHSHATDAEMLDALVYHVFPNFAPWGGFMPNIIYRWRPWPDQDKTLMEVRILTRVPPGTKPPRGIPMKFLRADQKGTEAPELGVLGDVFEQDMLNLPEVHEGLKASKNGPIQLGNHREIRIRQFQQTLDKYLAREDR